MHLVPVAKFSISTSKTHSFVYISLTAKESTKQKVIESASDYHTMVVTFCSVMRSLNFDRNSLTEWKVGNATERIILRVPIRISSTAHRTWSVA